jgi:hypothetical protein
MGIENNSFNWKSLKVALIACLMMILPVMSSGGGVGESNMMATQTQKSADFKAAHKSTLSDSCTAYFKGTSSVNNCRAGEVPLPAATWLFILALIAFVGLSNKKKV